ncbi:VPLPA-CTERM sorting domain-containing protein [Sulfitobacter sp. SK012]|uniref:VPLPA-CTERM sorting domain-containing protein n=1 Tax=Sulfitobacter sp. SK012 TaxID=1389005 RepID=UPI0020C82226|nr:VPLPA-CTERM sorting domain-containing protein [Sulfitobacter sp. SK012]
MKLLSILACGVLTISTVPTNAASVLIFGDRSSAQNNVQDVLEAQGDVVVNVSRAAVPMDLSVFDTIWSLSFNSSYGAALEDQMINFVGNGGGLYLTFERPCCEAANDSVERIVNASLLSGGVSVGGFGDVGGTFSFNPNAVGNVDADLAVGWVPSAPGQIGGVVGNSVAVSSDVTGRAVAAAWDEDALGSGRIAAFGDVDWLSSINDGEAQVVRNTQEFLFDGFVGPNPDPIPDPAPNPVPLPAAGWLLIAGLGGLGFIRRRRKTA